MKKTELILGVLIIGFSIGLFILSRQTTEPIASVQPQPKMPTVKESQASLTPLIVEQPASAAPAKSAEVQPAPKPAEAPRVQAQNSQPANPGKEPLHDPEAREALALVGTDLDADQYWLEAIFDTSLPDSEREDLMEDLNEVGFDDPKNLTADDVPLIVSRLQIIDAVLPSADDFMTVHLQEAQKDLGNMLAKVTQ